ncbi:MAG: hypothetical protein ACL93V_08240 [Candidatus Electrothrix sp. YB6]
MKIKTYSPEIETRMRNFYGSLSEKDRRRYVAVEAEKFGYGGITYICDVLRCDSDRVRRGIEELKQPLPEKEERIRKPGGGRKSVLSTAVGLDDAFFAVLKNHTAGLGTNGDTSEFGCACIRNWWTTHGKSEFLFETGRKTADGFKENMKIQFDEFLPKWNYAAVPSGRL